MRVTSAYYLPAPCKLRSLFWRSHSLAAEIKRSTDKLEAAMQILALDVTLAFERHDIKD
jgi:hypothetical protein